MDTKYIINPSCEFIEVDDGTVCLEENMETIYFIDTIGKIILEQFKEPITKNDMKNNLENFIENIIDNELFEFFDILINKNIIVPYKIS